MNVKFLITTVLCQWLAVTAMAANPALSKKEKSKMSEAQVYIVHGYMAAPTSHWFHWLKTELTAQAVKVHILSLPDSNNPKADAWGQTLKSEIKNLDKNTFIVGHSLGCITTLNFLSTLPAETRIGGLICVSGFSEPLPNIPPLNEFMKNKYDIAKVKTIAPKRAVFVSEDDVIVDPKFTKNLAKELEAPLTSLKKGGHFLDSDGYTKFPELRAELQKMILNK